MCVCERERERERETETETERDRERQTEREREREREGRGQRKGVFMNRTRAALFSLNSTTLLPMSNLLKLLPVAHSHPTLLRKTNFN